MLVFLNIFRMYSFLKYGVVIRSFSYINSMNLRVFYKKNAIWHPTTLHLGLNEY